jgi:hypothetical protein
VPGKLPTASISFSHNTRAIADENLPLASAQFCGNPLVESINPMPRMGSRGFAGALSGQAFLSEIFYSLLSVSDKLS